MDTACTSTGTLSHAPRRVVLPSIHDMFPEHIRVIPRATPASFPPALLPASAPAPAQSFSFDVLQSYPCAPSLQHVASSHPPTRGPIPSPHLLPVRPFSSADGEADAEVDDEEEGGEDKNMKHVCQTCGKRFNRPSSLRIHANTHTGATPFICPHPGCGRAFNVNSNMRRHFRNHGSAYALPRAPSKFDLSVSPLVQTALRIGSAEWRELELPAYSPASSSYSPDSAVSASSFSAASSRGSFAFTPKTPASPAYVYTHPGGVGGGARGGDGGWVWPYCESDVRSEPR